MNAIRIGAAAGLVIGCALLMTFALMQRRAWRLGARATVVIGVSLCVIGAAAAVMYLDQSMRVLALTVGALYVFTGAVYLRNALRRRT